MVGTTNRSEYMTGFFVKSGDGATDVEPILGLYKTQVRQLAAWLGVPGEIVRKAPSPDLAAGHRRRGRAPGSTTRPWTGSWTASSAGSTPRTWR